MVIEGGNSDWLGVEFLEKFEPRYQRNNKKLKQKNLRCFPQCLESGHTGTGFCGRPVRCRVWNLALDDPNTVIRAWAEFVEVNTGNQLRHGMSLPVSQILSKERSRDQPTLPWIRGEVTFSPDRKGEVSIVFNRQLLGWCYSWTSNKHTCDAFHELRVYVFSQPLSSNIVSFIGTVKSPHFQLFSRRRQNVFDTTAKRARDAANSSSSLPEPSASSSSSHALNSIENTTNQPQESQQAKRVRTTGEAVGNEVVKNSYMDPTRAKYSAAADEFFMDSMLEAKRHEMEENRCLDRLNNFLLQHGTGGDSATPLPSKPPPANVRNGDASTRHAEEFRESLATAVTAKPSEEDDPAAFLWDDFHDDFPPLAMLPPSESFMSLFSFADEQEQGAGRDSSQVDCLERLRTILTKDSVFTPEEVQVFVERIEAVSDKMIELSQNNAGFKRILYKYCSVDGLNRLKEQVALEKHITAFEWTPEHEDGTYDIVDTANNVEKSIYAEVRQESRNLMRECLRTLGFPLSYFYRFMDLAVANRLIQFEARSPPAVREAVALHCHLYGSVDKFAEQDYGSRKGKFASDEQQRVFARDLLIFKRGLFRRQLCDSIVQVQRLRKLYSRNDGFAHPDWDVNGRWVQESDDASFDSSEVQSMSGFGSLFRILGVPTGPFAEKLFASMFKFMHVRISATRLLLRFQQVLLASPEQCVPLAGPPEPFRPVSPVPVKVFSDEKLTTGWLDREKDGSPCIHIVIGSEGLMSEFPEALHFDELVEHDPSNEEVPDGVSQEQFEERRRVKSFFQSQSKSTTEVEMRCFQKIRIPTSGRRDSFVFSFRFFLFASHQKAPSMHSRDELAKFIHAPPSSHASQYSCIQTFYLEKTYHREFLPPDNNRDSTLFADVV